MLAEEASNIDDVEPSMLTDNLSSIQSDQTIMAMCTASSRFGCAVYRDSTINLIADRKDFGDMSKGINIMIQKINPDVVIVAGSSAQLLKFIDHTFSVNIIDIHRGERNVSDTVNPNFTLVIVPNNWFAISRSEETLVSSEWVESKAFRNREERLFFINTKIKKSVDVCAIRSISAIAGFVKYSYFAEKAESSADELHFPILDTKYIDPEPVLSIDKFTFLTLGILDTHNIKNSINDPNNPSLPSLYQILDQCQSVQGRKSMQSLFLWPIRDAIQLQDRYDMVEFFLRPENKLLREQIMIQLKNFVPLTHILSKLAQSTGGYKELSTVYKSLWAFLAILDLIRSNNCGNLVMFKRLLDLDSPELRAAIDSIINVIDFEASKREQRIQVCVGVDQVVDEKKEIVKNLAKFCDEVATSETMKYNDILNKTCKVLYIPRIGFLNSVQFSSAAELARIWAYKEFEVLLHTEQAVYFKTERMEELDRDAGDIACDLIDVQENVIFNLQDEMLRHSDTMLRIMDMCGELDCLIAFSIVSEQRNFCRPELTEMDGDLEIRSAFHPLQPGVVPNDVTFGMTDGRKTRIMIITGPNSCGKTTYMKMTCLIIYMAHIGCFVPARYARIPVVDAILTRMHSRNSISTGLSSFATDLNQINYALSRATSKSIIAVDEFGKGTQARDGFQLLKGLIVYFANRGLASPYTMITTHYNRLIDHLRPYANSILYKTFRVVRDTSKDVIVYEYKLIDGVCEASLADEVALKAGVSVTIIQRAGDIRNYITEGCPIQPRVPRAA